MKQENNAMINQTCQCDANCDATLGEYYNVTPPTFPTVTPGCRVLSLLNMTGASSSSGMLALMLTISIVRELRSVSGISLPSP